MIDRSVVDGLDVLRGKVSNASVATALPAQRIRAVEDIDDITSYEAELGWVLGGEVEKGVCMVRALEEVYVVYVDFDAFALEYAAQYLGFGVGEYCECY